MFFAADSYSYYLSLKGSNYLKLPVPKHRKLLFDFIFIILEANYDSSS